MPLKKNKLSSDLSSNSNISLSHKSDISPIKKSLKNNKKKSLIQICQEWYQNKLNNPLNPINPLTDYTVKQNGPKYRELENLCKKVKINR